MTSVDNGIVRRALVVAAVVGPVLILINQGDALFGDAAFAPLKAGLTVVVPFCVSLVSGLLAAQAFARVLAEHEQSWAADIARLQARIVTLEDRAERPERRRHG